MVSTPPYGTNPIWILGQCSGSEVSNLLLVIFVYREFCKFYHLNLQVIIKSILAMIAVMIIIAL